MMVRWRGSHIFQIPLRKINFSTYEFEKYRQKYRQIDLSGMLQHFQPMRYRRSMRKTHYTILALFL
jgi:hypothetical protein